ncbi:hypothetical protein FALBO_9186 [Fusarium albosuccineum]|uniref:Infection structure specific protein n=1 Tax=Fusarium albosuccineum TaxID=1237068 RepID=A0A8H4L6J1_9HYPO|nr:hypothetical protein FALBO_9186 [Fusarium albosuccineum]
MRAHFLLAAAATAVVAQNNEKRDAEECMKVATDLLPKLTDVPTPSGSLASWLATQTQYTPTDNCEIPKITGDMADDFTSYASKLSSWYDDQKDDFSSLLDACKDVAELTSELDSLGQICTEVTWADGGGSKSSSKDDDDNAASSAPIKAGLVAGVAAVVGVFVAAF